MYLAYTGQENQDIACVIARRLTSRGDALLDNSPTRAGRRAASRSRGLETTKMLVHRKGVGRYGNHRRMIQIALHQPTVQCSGHQHQP